MYLGFVGLLGLCLPQGYGRFEVGNHNWLQLAIRAQE